MKRFWILIVLLVSVCVGLYAGDDRPIRFEQLPEKAQTFVKSYFPQDKVALVKLENDFFDKKYEVIFISNSRIEFDKNGVWYEVDCKANAVPVNIVPKTIMSYVQTNYSDKKIVQIEKDKKGYEVKLSNGLSLEFDKNFRLIDIDD